MPLFLHFSFTLSWKNVGTSKMYFNSIYSIAHTLALEWKKKSTQFIKPQFLFNSQDIQMGSDFKYTKVNQYTNITAVSYHKVLSIPPPVFKGI